MPLFRRSNSQRSLKQGKGGAKNEQRSSSPPQIGLDLVESYGNLGSLQGAREASTSDRGLNDGQNGSAMAQFDGKTCRSDVSEALPPSATATSPPSGRHKTSINIARSQSQPQVPAFHMPWTRNLQLDEAAKLQGNSTQNAMTPSQSWSPAFKRSSSPPQAAFEIVPVPPILDFRVSPNTLPQPTPAQKKQTIDAARRISLKKAKAAAEFNILVMGARNTGKTSFIRTLLSTLDLSSCSYDRRVAAASFGVAPSDDHPTRATDPITPLPTRSITQLSGIELHHNSFAPTSAMDQLNGGGQRGSFTSTRRDSVFSSTTAGGSGSKRFQLSICDTPGIDFEMEDDFEIDQKVSSIAKHVESIMLKKLADESKLQRSGKSDKNIHLIIYFIDPRYLVERSASRRKAVMQRRHGVMSALGQRRPRSQSESRPATNSVGLTRSESLSHHAVAGGRATSEEIEDDGDSGGIEGLSATELKILVRMSKFANILPIVAKADTLTAMRSIEVRQAVRKSLRAAKIDLGTFDLGLPKSRRKKEAIKRPVTADVDPGTAEPDKPSDGSEPVKVIHIRSRRSYSVTGDYPDRPESLAGHASSFAHGAGSPDVDFGSSIHHTDPLYPDAVDDEAKEEQAAHDEFVKLIPPALFVPEPVRLTRRKRSTIAAPSSSAAADEEGRAVPPVPAITDSVAFNETIEAQGWERLPQSSPMSPVPDTDSPPLPPAIPTFSTRYERNYRWGSANMLDPKQCDFSLIRSAIFGTHLDMLRDSTAVRYEAIRSQRLELNQLLRDGVPLPV